MKKLHRIHVDTPTKRALMSLPATTVCSNCKAVVPVTDKAEIITLCITCSTRLFEKFRMPLSGLPGMESTCMLIDLGET